jgi:hypothetical protein
VKQLSLLEWARQRDPIASDAQHIECIAAATIAELDERPPVDLAVVASYRDIADIRYDPLLPFAGCLGPEAGRLVMRLRATDSWARQRFTGFHEVGHSFQPGYVEVRQLRCAHPSAMPRGTKDPEALADAAAAALLLPTAHFLGDTLRTSFGLSGVLELAGLYQASIQATAFRFARFWPEPVLVLVLELGFRKEERGRDDAVAKLRVRSRVAFGQWGFVPQNKSVLETGLLHAVLAGGSVTGRTTLAAELGLSDDREVEVSAAQFPYCDANGLRQRVIALVRRPNREDAVRRGSVSSYA